ncbi:MAG: pilus assembly protein [Lentisphaerae bacterium]|nr:pilus assembly protein [Lentisphaerota bacterium]
MTEYIIIVVIVALAALTVFGLFGDRIRAMVGGAVEELGGDASSVQDAVGDEGDSKQYLKDLKPSQ